MIPIHFHPWSSSSWSSVWFTRQSVGSAMLLLMIMVAMLPTNGIAKQTANSPENDTTKQLESEAPSNYILIKEVPTILKQGSKVVVEYYCEEDSVVTLDLTVMVQDLDGYFTVFSKAWKCRGQGNSGQIKTKTVRLRLPDSIAYRPDYFNKADTVWMVTGSKVRAWLVDEVTWTKGQNADEFGRTGIREFQKVTVLPPYSRPFKKRDCTIWIWPYVQKLYKFADSQMCDVEPESVTLLDYPAVFNGYAYSILRDFQPFKDPGLERDRLQRRYYPQMTVELWVYILDYCPMHHLSPADACGLFLHMDAHGQLLSPVLLINKYGNIQIDVKGSNGYIAMKSSDAVPKNVWTRILFSFNARTWVLHVNYGPHLSQGFWTMHTYDENIFIDDTEGLMSIGGIDWIMGSFVGYMGRVVYHRQRVLAPDQITPPSPFHPMFELHLARRQEKCQNFMSWMNSAVDVFQKYQKYVVELRDDKCPNQPYQLLAKYAPSSLEDFTTCPPKLPHSFRYHKHVGRLLQNSVYTHSLSTNFLEGELEAYSRSYRTDEGENPLHDISLGLIEKSTALVRDKGLRQSHKVVQLLKQAACLGNDDAMFSLAVLLNNGVGGSPDEIQSLAFFMLGTLNRHIYSVMALGHRHVMGIDGAPVDKDVAFMYYKQVADQSRKDKEEHKESGIATESIRLVDEAKIEAQTSEVGDLFLWLKNQAERGVASAQSELGAMMYHGAQGIKRNLQNAINVFRDGAENGNVDAMFNYGIMQYRGMGAGANKSEGRKMMEKAAELKNPNAVSALGWLALEVDKNMTQAALMFNRAKEMEHMDSGYYLGFMYHFGLMPNSSVDLDRALEEYLWSAVRQQIDAGNSYAYLISRGTQKHPRDINTAIEWARFIAEKNSHLAIPLREALNAYRDGNYDLSLYWYLLLADTGLEVASFNLAYLCEQNKDGIRSFISKDCEWRHYNLTTQREFQFVDSYSYIKMGDYHWYGCRGKRDMKEAARHYFLAALKGDPHALFNLGYMVEEGVKVSPIIWLNLGIPYYKRRTKSMLLLNVYAKCRESKQSEAFIPCCLAWFRIWFLDVWEQYHLYMKITSLVGVIIVVVTSGFLLYHYIRQWKKDRVEERQRRDDEEEERRTREVAEEI